MNSLTSSGRDRRHEDHQESLRGNLNFKSLGVSPSTLIQSLLHSEFILILILILHCFRSLSLESLEALATGKRSNE